MFDKIIGVQEGKHIVEMCLVVTAFPDTLVYEVIAVKSIVFI